MRIDKSYFLIFLSFSFLLFGCVRDPLTAYPDGGGPPLSGSTSILDVTSPDIGDIWVKGSSHEIKWKVSIWIESIDIELYRKTQLISAIAANVPTDSVIVWRVPYDLPQSVHYKIKIINCSKRQEFGFSDPFSIME